MKDKVIFKAEDLNALDKKFLNILDTYQEYLNIYKGFFGNDFPLINKFEFMLKRFKIEMYKFYKTVERLSDL